MTNDRIETPTIMGRWTYQQDPNLLATVQGHLAGHIRAVLGRALGQADDWLFDQSQKDEPMKAAKRMEDLRVLRGARPHLEKAVDRYFQDGFQALARQTPTEAAGSRTLSLVEEDQMDVQLASEMVVEALARTHGPALEAIERRFAVVVGVGKLDPALNPLSAARLGNVLRAAQSEVVLSSDVRVVLFKYFERELVQGLEALLIEINARLASAGILPELGTPKAVHDAAATAPATKPAAPVEAPAPASADDQQLFTALCDLLHTWRPQSGERAPAAGGGAGMRPMVMPEMMSVLSLLQTQVPNSVSFAAANREASLAALFKQELIDSAVRIGLPSNQLKLGREDEDAIDLVGMLFDVMFDERDFEQLSRTLMSRMVVPYMKAALLDRKMFMHKQHPARRLLNSLAEACEGNRGEGPQERELLQKAEGTVDRLVSDFNEDVAIFELLEQEMRSYLGQHQRRVELSERRAAEAQRGQERLEQARELASFELDRRSQRNDLPLPVQEFLSRHWTHHLSMIALREGPDGSSWQAALGVADSLLDLLPHAGKTPRAVAPVLSNMREPLESVLASCGLTGETAQDLIRQLGASLSLAARSGELPAAASKPEPQAKPVLAVVGGTDQLDFDPQDAEQIRQLKAGQWIDLAGEDGRLHPAKLSWVSPISSRLMFVNRRGVRVLVASAEELAALKRTGKLALREQATIFDQALHRVMDRLKPDAVG